MKTLLKIILLVFVCWACSDDPVETVFFDLNTKTGVFISCEGNFMYGNSSLSFYNTETGKVTNQLFYARNNVPLGDVAQSLAFYKNTLFVVVNNSGKIYAINPETAEFKGVIRGLISPRYIHFLSPQSALVSDLYASHITVFNPETFEIKDTIGLDGHTSEQMAQIGKYVFVSAWSFDEYILVIDAETHELVDKFKVPFQPKDLVVDANDKLWVFSQGSTEDFSEEEIPPALSRIDPVTQTIEQVYRFDPGDLPTGLEINGTKDTLFFINNGIYKMAVNSRHLPDSAFIRPKKLFYTLGINPNNNEIYISDAIDYTQNAMIYRYSQAGELKDTFHVGISPSDFLFR